MPDERTDETAEQRRARRIVEARAKLGKSAPADDSPAGTAPPAEAAPPPPTSAPEPSAPPVPEPTVPAAGRHKAKAGLEIEDATNDAVVARLGDLRPRAIAAAVRVLGQTVVTVSLDGLPETLGALMRDPRLDFDLLLDLTAVHRPDEAPAFEIVYHLVSTRSLARLRVKVPVEDGQSVPTATTVWPAADWLERECYDMFGIVFDGHPDLRRILLPEGWEGHPLRKEYPVEFRENRWVRENLNIVEIPAGGDFAGKFEA